MPLSSKILEPVAGLFNASVFLPVASPPSPPHLELWEGGELLPSQCSPRILFSQAAPSGCAVSLSTRVAWPGHPYFFVHLGPYLEELPYLANV